VRTCRSLSAMACAWHSASASVALRSSARKSAARAASARYGTRESGACTPHTLPAEAVRQSRTSAVRCAVLLRAMRALLCNISQARFVTSLGSRCVHA